MCNTYVYTHVVELASRLPTSIYLLFLCFEKFKCSVLEKKNTKQIILTMIIFIVHLCSYLLCMKYLNIKSVRFIHRVKLLIYKHVTCDFKINLQIYFV